MDGWRVLKYMSFVNLKKKKVVDFFWHLLSLLLANWLVPIIINCGTESLAVTFCHGSLDSKILPVFSGSLRLENSQFFTKWMCFWQYWDFCSLCRCGCCSQNLFTSIQFIQLFIIPLWSPSLSLFLSPLTLSFPCFLCLSVSVHSVFLLSQRHIFRPLLLWWQTPWRSQWWDWPFHIKWVVNRICSSWPEYEFWHEKTNTGKYKFDSVECLLCMGKTGEPTMNQALYWDWLLKCLCRWRSPKEQDKHP